MAVRTRMVTLLDDGRARVLRGAIRAVLIALLATTGLTATTAAHAQREGHDKISAKDRREAKRLFNQAHLSYRRGDYEEAILKWLRSFELSKEPLIFESIANAYERLGDYKAALDYLSRWREKAPRREHESLDTRIENLKRRVDEQLKKEEAQKAERERLAREREEAAKREADYEEKLEKKDDGDAGGDGLNTIEIVGWSLVGVGGAAVVAGVVVDIVAAVQRPDKAQVCLDQAGSLLCSDGERQNIELTNREAIAGDVMWIAGLAIGAAGGGILLWQALGSDSADDDAASDARLTPWAGPGGAGVGVSGHF
jgi:tetratricopeptide (TPR) repeat protein